MGRTAREVPSPEPELFGLGIEVRPEHVVARLTVTVLDQENFGLLAEMLYES